MVRLFSHDESESPDRATVSLDPSTRADREVFPELFGKFGEHLYSPWQVKNALEAQTLFNPTFGSWKFQDRRFGADGGRGSVHDPDEIEERIERYADVHDLPDAERMQAAYDDGCALWWFPHGDADAVRTSPEVGTAGDRAQRIELLAADERSGVAQWCYLPTHRTRSFEGKATVRADEATEVRLAIHGETGSDGTLGEPLATETVTATADYETVAFELTLPSPVPTDHDALFGFSVTIEGGDANVVVDRALVYPDDHVDTADPEIVDLFEGIDLPVLRWPGGNFVSGYHWEDGVGPIEERPTRPNPAWDAIEPNLFGTDEFVAFCEAVGCEPMICLNAGNGSAEEAARWVEYCNGSTDTEMGALRAEHGHPEPYDVTYWEVGNEIYGEWQISWTTAGGNADRFARFREAMMDVDPDIEVMACGNRLTDWNDPVLAEMADGDWLTDHVLLECHADPMTDPVELFNTHTGIPTQLGEEYRAVAEDCREAGIDPKVAITELQLFTRLDEPDEDDESPDGEEELPEEGERLTRETLPNSDGIAEAVFDAAVINQCIRDGVVEMVTHSGAGNHGGGIRKHKERVWADPCLYGLGMGTALGGGSPIGVDVASPTFSTETTFGTDTSDWFGVLRPVEDEPTVDAVAVADADDHDLAVLLAHRDAGGETIEVALDGLAGIEEATVTTLTADAMHEGNAIDEPRRISPTEDHVRVDGGEMSLTLSPFSVVTITADRA